MSLNGNNIKIAIQKNGRLAEKSLRLLKKAGLSFEVGSGRLFASCENFPLDILFVRDDDIPEYVRDGVCDLGIVGRDVLKESEISLETLLELGFGKCHLAIAVPKEGMIENIKDLQQKRIATSYPRVLARYLRENKIDARVVSISGSVELAPSLKVADAICDLVSTGSTLRTHDLKSITTVLESQAVLVVPTQNFPTAEKAAIIDQLARRIDAVLAAERTKYIVLNAPKNKVDEIARVIPGIKSPTVMPLYNPDWVAIHSVVPEDKFWRTVDILKSIGAQGILVLPIEKIIL
jgi:ATP phosphoribosyltransferase